MKTSWISKFLRMELLDSTFCRVLVVNKHCLMSINVRDQALWEGLVRTLSEVFVRYRKCSCVARLVEAGVTVRGFATNRIPSYLQVHQGTPSVVKTSLDANLISLIKCFNARNPRRIGGAEIEGLTTYRHAVNTVYPGEVFFLVKRIHAASGKYFSSAESAEIV